MVTERYSEKKYNVLMIDYDHSASVEQLTESIKDCEFIHIHSQERAFDFFFNNEIDLVVLDHQPGKPCIEPLKFLKSTKPSIPVIVSTAFGSEDLAVKVFRIGARDYLRKPLLAEELKSSVGSALGIKDISDDTVNKNYLEGIYRAVDLIHRNYTSRINLERAAREAGMSISSFVRAFKRETGITFTLYVNRLRIARAVTLLKEDKASMSDIAFACGFTNQFHFTRTFKKIMQTTPSRYKKSIMSE